MLATKPRILSSTSSTPAEIEVWVESVHPGPDVQPARPAFPAWVEKRANLIVDKVPGSRSNVIAHQPVATGRNAGNSSAQLLTVWDVAAHFQVSEKTIRRLIKAGDLPVVRIGRSVRINPEAIEYILLNDE